MIECERDPAYELAVRVGLDFQPETVTTLRAGPISSAPFGEALRALLTLSARHDYWWPLVCGSTRIERALVIEDSWGALASNLTRHCDNVTAVFPTPADSELLRSAIIANSSIDIAISTDPIAEEKLWAQRWPLIVLQRPAANSLRLIERAQGSLTPDGVLVVVDDLRHTLTHRIVGAIRRRSAGAARNGFDLSRLLRIAPHTDVWVSREKLEPSSVSLPELFARRSRSSFQAWREARRVHAISHRRSIGFIEPRSALAIASNQPPRSLVDRVLQDSAVLSVSEGAAPIVKQVIAGAGQTTVLLAGPARRRRNSVVLRVADSYRAARRVQANASMLKTLSGTDLEPIAPRLLLEDRGPSDIYVTVESCLRGRPLLGIKPGPEKDALLTSAANRWARFREPRTAVQIVSSDTYEALIGTALSHLVQYATPGDSEGLARLGSELKRRLVGRTWPLGPFHGDFKVGNILIDRRGNLSGIIDWDCSTGTGLPLLDVITLCVYEDAREKGQHLVISFLEGVIEGRWRSAYSRMVADECARLGLDREAQNTLTTVFWLVNLRDRVHWLALSHESEAQRNLSQPVERLCALIGA